MIIKQSEIETKKGNSLLNKRIVITRPVKQAKSLAKNIEKVGGCPLHFPLIEITPLNDETTFNKVSRLDDYDVIIFVSVNAVEQCINLVGAKPLENKIIVSTGKKTAEKLEENNLQVNYCPDKYFNSEALLAVEGFKSAVANKNIAIVRGSNGRDFLKNNLMKLGAKVDYIDVYKRHCPQKDLSNLETLWSQQKVDIVLLTSASSTANFFSLANNEVWLDKLTILLGSSRMEHEIPSKFKGKILTADDPSDETLFEYLITLYE